MQQRFPTDKIAALLYVSFWALLMLAATFPALVTQGDISFIKELPMINQSCLFPLVMVVVVHLIDEAYLVFTSEIRQEHLKSSFIFNLIFLALVAVFLMFTTTVACLWLRLVFFALTWISFIVIKYLSIGLSQPQTVQLIDLTNNNQGA